MSEEKRKSLFGTLLQKENMYCADTIIEDLSTKVPNRPPFWCTSPTMSWMSVHGYQPGTCELLYGPKSSGKTMIALDRIKHALASDPESIAVYVDAELDFEYDATILWMRANGVDTKRVLLVREVNIKTVFEKKLMGEVGKAIKDEGVRVSIIIVDSVQGLAVSDIDEKKAAKGEMAKQDHGARANYLSRILPFFRQFIRNNRIFVTFIGQARSGGEDWKGNQIWATNGGEAFYHEMQYRHLITKAPDSEDIYSETTDANGKPVKIGHRIRFECEKNKMGEGLGREGFADIIYMKGITNVENELIDLAKNIGLIQQAGAWFQYGETKFNGSKLFAEFLRNSPQEYSKLLSLAIADASNPLKYSAGSKLK